jgi:hypothetical protein
MKGGNMSTRGIVAIKKDNGWVGVYNHSDSYPTCLGRDLIAHLKELNQQKKLEQFSEELLKYDDWKNYARGGICPYCGGKLFTSPHDISGEIWGVRQDLEMKNASNEIKENIKSTGYPDPECKYHKHQEKVEHYTPEDADPLFIEWVYVYDPSTKEVEIYTHARAPGFYKRTANGRTWEEPKYEWKLVRKVSIIGQYPNFEEIEKEGDKIREEAYYKY